MIYTRPDWAVPGCLPRESKVGEVCPLLKEKINIIPQEEWADHIGDVSLKHFVKSILMQGRISSCAAEATTQAVMTCRVFEGKPHVLLNPWTLYCFTSGGRDRGSTLDENLQQAREVGILPDSIWPRSQHAWNEKPPMEFFEEHAIKIGEFAEPDSINAFGSGLIGGYGGVYARDVHALFAHELLNNLRFGYTNSYDSDWGDNGQSQEALSVIEWRYGAFFVLNTV